MSSLAEDLAAELQALQAIDRLRTCPPLSGATRVRPQLAGTRVVAFCSNDYLGLSQHPALADAAAAAAQLRGYGSGASRLISGDWPEHRSLEQALSTFLGLPAALLFPTGYQANLSVLTALAGHNDLIASDAANHASIIDGCRLSRATVSIYAHADAEAARAALARPGAFRRRLLVTESLFSMDGDVAPVQDLAAIAAEAGAALIVDEAHALGCVGPAGRGVCAAANVTPDVLIGTLGKAFGTFGGFVAGPPELRAYLVNRARAFIYTTAPPLPVAAASLAAVHLARGTEGDARRRRLHENIQALTRALPLSTRASSHPSPIIPIILGADGAALQASAALFAAGFFVQAIRPPTVPEGTARLRVTLSAAHDPADISRLAATLGPMLTSS